MAVYPFLKFFRYVVHLTVKLPICVCVHLSGMVWTTENTSTHDRCESHSESQTEGALLTFDLWCRSAPCCSTSSLIRSRWPLSANNRTAILPSCEHEWHIHNQSMPLCHILYIPQYIRQCRPDTSVVSTALQYWNIQAQSLQVLSVAIGGCTLTLFSSSSEDLNSLWSIRTNSAWPL